MNLTCNQAMVLLDIYRGTFNKERHMATCPVDLRTLEAGGLIIKKIVWYVTDEGTKRVERMLE